LADVERKGMNMLSDHPIGAMIPCQDLARAKAFYADTLGFKVIREQDEGVEFESGGVRFDIYPTRASGGTATVAGWVMGAGKLEAEVEDLRNRGVTFEQVDVPGIKTDERGIAEIEGFKGAWFKDSEGNVLAVTEETG
jgi:catechol 2,3-dioxygenase-like lactoylglutathione lyase family enzyme